VLAWIIDDFNAQTHVKAGREPCTLFMDGHSSHYTPDLLQFVLEHNIFILGYPPHCTHALQGLDIVCFAQMKLAWTEEVKRFEAEHDCGVNKGYFAGVFGVAFQKAFIEDTICAAFRATGLVPFNPNIITPSQMKPNVPTAIKGAFPLPQPSPVCAVIAAFHHQPPTVFNTEIDTHMMAGPSTHCSIPSSPCCSSPSHPNSNLNPALFTPSK
jgi:hypothetical protein